MLDFCVIADDLTGANATGAMLAKSGFKVASITDFSGIEALEKPEYDGLVINTSSRSIDEKTAFERTKNIAEHMHEKGVRYFGKRIDSTLRGNLGAEIEGVLFGLDESYTAILVPSFPSSGRVTVGGYLLVNGVPLEKTDAARDPKTPIRKSKVVDILQHTSMSTGSIPLDIVLQGPDIIKRSIDIRIKNGNKVIIIDAVNDDDIKNIALAVKLLGIKAVSVDPGPFTNALMSEYLKTDAEHDKVMVIAGSVTPVTRSQLDYVEKYYDAKFINIDVANLLEDRSGHYLKSKANELIQLGCEDRIFGLRVAKNPEMVLDLKSKAEEMGLTVESISRQITLGLAQISRDALNFLKYQVKGIYLTGGDMLAALCEVSDTKAIALKKEVMPLVAYGHLAGGEFDGLAIVSKGGLVGNIESAKLCIDYILNY